MWILDRGGGDDRPVRRTAGRMEGTRSGRTCAGLPRPRTNALDSPPARAKWGATIRPPTTSPCTRSLAPCPLTLPVCAFPSQSLDDSALRLRLRRCGCTIGDWAVCWVVLGLDRRSWAITAPRRLFVCVFVSRETNKPRWSAVCCPMRYRVPVPRPVPFAVVRSHQKPSQDSPLALALPACVRPVALPPTGQYYPAQSPRVGLTSAPAGESGERPRFPPVPHCQVLRSTGRS